MKQPIRERGLISLFVTKQKCPTAEYLVERRLQNTLKSIVFVEKKTTQLGSATPKTLDWSPSMTIPLFYCIRAMTGWTRPEWIGAAVRSVVFGSSSSDALWSIWIMPDHEFFVYFCTTRVCLVLYLDIVVHCSRLFTPFFNFLQLHAQWPGNEGEFTMSHSIIGHQFICNPYLSRYWQTEKCSLMDAEHFRSRRMLILWNLCILINFASCLVL